ncbi:MAG: UDP-N-acetylmuramate dehydrogenase, partial [Eubacterium aggregans]|nr:UDP-N-acetylmuramate dehydrogenase [Eubacterium aggregans]
VVTGVKLRLKDGDYNTIQGKMKDFNDRRRSKQPLEYPSAGSTFRRPAGYFAGKLIQDSGMQGATVGGARVSEKHAGFVINGGDATARDIQDLIAKVQAEVLGQYGVALKTEVIMIGEECD